MTYEPSDAFEAQMEEAFDAFLESAQGASLEEVAELTGTGHLSFDIYARDPLSFTELAERAPQVKVLSAGGRMPFQAEGLIGDYYFYLRSEEVYPLDDEAPATAYTDLRVVVDREDLYDGQGDWKAESEELTEGHNLEEALLTLIPQLQESAGRYFFEGWAEGEGEEAMAHCRAWDPRGLDKSHQAEECAWGLTEEEAYRALFERTQEYMDWWHEYSKGKFSSDLEAWRAYQRAREFSPEAVRTDKRLQPPHDFNQYVLY